MSARPSPKLSGKAAAPPRRKSRAAPRVTKPKRKPVAQASRRSARAKSPAGRVGARSVPSAKPSVRKPTLVKAQSPVAAAAAHEHSFTPRPAPARLYRRGDKVVLPPYGVGIVEGTVSRMVAGSPRQYYEVGFPGGTSRAYIPVDSPEVTGFRAALTPAEVSGVLERLRTGRMSLPKQWAARNRRVTEILASGDAHRIAVLAAELRRRDAERGLPDLDRQSYRRAIRFLAGEVASATGASMPEVREMMEGVADQDDLFA